MNIKSYMQQVGQQARAASRMIAAADTGINKYPSIAILLTFIYLLFIILTNKKLF